MKILKTILVLLAILIAIPLIAAIFLPKTYVAERSVTIEKPTAEVFDYVKMLKNQNNFSKWANVDTAMKKTFKGDDGKVGFVSAWDSQNEEVGAGEQEIKKMEEGKRIDYELRFLRPFESTETAYIATDSLGKNKTKVTWAFNGHMNYPKNIMLPFLKLDSKIGDDLSAGLGNLKGILEGKKDAKKKKGKK